jgi:hypothetical protein
VAGYWIDLDNLPIAADVPTLSEAPVAIIRYSGDGPLLLGVTTMTAVQGVLQETQISLAEHFESLVVDQEPLARHSLDEIDVFEFEHGLVLLRGHEVGVAFASLASLDRVRVQSLLLASSPLPGTPTTPPSPIEYECDNSPPHHYWKQAGLDGTDCPSGDGFVLHQA